MAKTVEIVEEKICPIIEKLGYEVVEVEFAKKVDGMNLTFYIDSPNGITLDDCEKVHKAIDAPLDEVNPTGDGAYILNVSSCGLDRPLKTNKDLKRNLGNEVEITLFAKQDGNKFFKGVLESFDEKTITLKMPKQTLTFEREKIGSTKLVIKF